jgi:hypothetical protein
VGIVKKVWSSDRKSGKLDYPLTRPYTILSRKDDNFKLDTPASWKAHPNYHASRLRKYSGDPLPGQGAENPPGEVIDQEEEWEVEEVISSRLHYGTLQYQVSWKGWDPDPTWYPAENLKGSPGALRRYHDAYPDHAGPSKRLMAWEEAFVRGTEPEDHPDDNKATTGKTTLRRTLRKRGS